MERGSSKNNQEEEKEEYLKQIIRGFPTLAMFFNTYSLL
jgi:hypothetical protein